MGRLNEKQLTILTIVVALVITGLFGYLIHRDLGAMDQEEQKIESSQGKIRAADLQIQKMAGREMDVIVNREVVKRDSAILPDESEINEFINLIGDFEKRSGVLVTQIQGLSNRTRSRGKGKAKVKEAILRIPMKLRLLGTMDQFLNFVNLFENHDRFVSVTGFNAKRSDNVDRKGNLRHEISLELETYQYNPRGGPVKQVDLANYEVRKEDATIQKRIRLYKPAHIEKYQLKARISRRDPLVDPREAINPEDESDVDPEAKFKAERELLNDIKLALTLLCDDLRFEEQLRAERNTPRLGGIVKLNDQRISQLDFRIQEVLANRSITVPELKEEFRTLVVKVYEDEKEKRHTRPTEILVQRQQVLDQLRSMQKKFEERDYKHVIDSHEGFLRLIDGRKLSPDAKLLKEEIDALAHKAEVINKFNAEPLTIRGVIIDEDRGSFAYINDQILAEGQAVDDEGKIRIQEIRSDEIEFIYQDVTIVKPLRGGK